MDNHMVAAVVQWPGSHSIKHCNIFSSSIAAPLTSQLKGDETKLKWNLATTQTFSDCKGRFTLALEFKHPYSTLTFTVEVDALNTEVGAILSHRQGNPSNTFKSSPNDHTTKVIYFISFHIARGILFKICEGCVSKLSQGFTKDRTYKLCKY